MLRKLKQSVALVLIVTLFITMFTLSPNAAEINKPSTSVDTSDYSVTGENTFGEMISSEIAKSQNNAADFDSEYKLFDVTIEGNTANVEYHSLSDCTILVAVYDERSDKMLASGKSKAFADKEAVEVILETETMPQYFVVKVYMLDENNAPLTDCLVEELYTESVQRVVTLDSSEFDEKKVLNFDEDTTTNFAIYNDNAKIVKASEYNIPTSIDEKSGTYSFTNCDDKLTSLKKEDILAYEYKKGGVLIVKINEIKVDGTNVTITEDSNLELKDVFDYIKIESTQTSQQAEVDTSSADDGVTYKGCSSESYNNSGKETSSVGASWSDETGVSENFEVEFPETEVGKVGISGKAGLSLFLSVSVELYIGYVWEIDAHYIDFSIEYGVQIEGEIEVKFSKPIKKVLSTITIPVIPEVVTVTFEPKIVFELSAKFTATLKYSGTVGFKATLTNGVEDMSKPMKVDAKLKVEGDGFIGLDFCPSVQFVNRYVAEVELNFTAGARIHAELEVGTKDKDDDHECTYCVSGTMGPEASISGEVSLVTKTVGNIGHTFKFFTRDFYYSIDHNKFGWGECPYVINRKCGPKAFWKLDDNGTLVIFGEGTTYDYYGYDESWWIFSDEIKKVVIKEGITRIGIGLFKYCTNLTSISIPNSVTEIGGSAFQDCESLINVNIPDGISTIKGATFRNCKSIKSVNIPNSVTEIGDYAFENCESLINVNIPYRVTKINIGTFDACKNLTSIDIPDTVTIIDEYAFDSCESLINVNIPYRVTKIGNVAFFGCKSLKNINLPDSVTEIGRSAFALSGITSIKIPSGVSTLDQTFYDCKDLNTIYLVGDRPGITDYTFYNVRATLYYPANNDTYEFFSPNRYGGGDSNISAVPTGTSVCSVAALPKDMNIKSDTSENVLIEAKFNKIANSEYIISIVKDLSTEDVLSSDNLIYITQVKADESGYVSVSIPISSDVTDYHIMIFGPENGDVNKDGEININDATDIQKYLVGFTKFSNLQIEIADINGDGKITVGDVTMLQKYLAGFISVLN